LMYAHNAYTAAPQHTCINSSRMVYTGSERRCCPIVFSREKALAPSCFLPAASAFIFCRCALNWFWERWPPPCMAQLQEQMCELLTLERCTLTGRDYRLFVPISSK